MNTYKDDHPDGLKTWYYENGQKECTGTYKEGVPDGLHTLWYETGQKKSEATFKEGERVLWTEWYENG